MRSASRTDARDSNVGRERLSRWSNRAAATKWLTAGVGASDCVGGKIYATKAVTATGAQSLAITLDPTIVQSWVAGNNQGVLLDNPQTNAVVRLMSSKSATVAQRPQLSITYSN